MNKPYAMTGSRRKGKESNGEMVEGDSSTQQNPVEVVRKVLTDGNLFPREFGPGEGFVIDLEDEFYEGAIAYVLEDEKRFVFYIDFRDKAEEKARPHVAEFITKANNGILVGNFEMDYADGTVRYKTSIDFEGSDLTYALVRNAVAAGRDSVETYGRFLVEVMKGNMSAERAMNEIEADTRD